MGEHSRGQENDEYTCRNPQDMMVLFPAHRIAGSAEQYYHDQTGETDIVGPDSNKNG